MNAVVHQESFALFKCFNLKKQLVRVETAESLEELVQKLHAMQRGREAIVVLAMRNDDAKNFAWPGTVDYRNDDVQWIGPCAQRVTAVFLTSAQVRGETPITSVFEVVA